LHSALVTTATPLATCLTATPQPIDVWQDVVQRSAKFKWAPFWQPGQDNLTQSEPNLLDKKHLLKRQRALQEIATSMGAAEGSIGCEPIALSSPSTTQDKRMQELIKHSSLAAWPDLVGIYGCAYQEALKHPSVVQAYINQVALAMIGSHVYIDYRYLPWVSTDHLSSLEGSLFLVDGDCFNNRTMLRHTASVLTAIEHLDVRGKSVADFGCAEGLLSLLALKQGARHTIGIDRDFAARRKFAHNLILNGIDPSRGHVVQADLNRERELRRTLQDRQVVFVNIGPHRIYGSTHLYALKLAATLPQVETIVIGGYTLPRNEDQTHVFYYGDAARLLEAYGFSVAAMFDIPYQETVSLVFERATPRGIA